VTPEQIEEIKAFITEQIEEIKAVKERNEMLMACDIDKMLAFQAKHNLGTFSSREVVEIALHKARTAAESLPTNERMFSKQWLKERGYSSFDDDLP
jgi:hypothetical protein